MSGQATKRISALVAGIALALLLLAPAALAAGTGAPIDVRVPTVGGKLLDETTATANPGLWEGSATIAYTYQWQRCNSAGEASSCANIAGATAKTYKLQHADVSSTVRAVVTATNGLGSATAASKATAVVKPSKPAKVKMPTLAGTAQDGKLETVSTGTWKGTPPLTYTYQWKQCAMLVCSVISGATEQTYRPTTSQIGDQLRAIVTAHNAAGSAIASTAATRRIVAGPPVNVSAPTVSGVPIDGQTLTAANGTWAGTAPYSFTYQWSSCSLLTEECTPIAGATASTYQAGPLDVGTAIEVKVTATSRYGTGSGTSAPTNAVNALLPFNVKLPSIGGLIQDGQLLSVISGVWSGTEPIALTYQWKLCNAAGEACKDINGAVGTGLSLIASFVGETVRVVETATNGAGSVSQVSEPTSVVAALLPANLKLPSVTGSLIDGQLLSAVTGEWSGSGPLSFAYQWQLCNGAGEACEDVKGATEAVLSLLGGDVGKTVRVVVTAANSAGSVSQASEPTSVIGALLPANVSLPSIAGSLIDGQLLSAATGEWSGTSPISYAYQWLQCNASGASCKEISGATGATMALVSSLVGNTVEVAVKATNGGGTTEAVSPATSAIGALLPGNTALPSITGLLQDGQSLAAVVGSWSGTAPISYAYQWQKCNAKGEACEDLSGKTGEMLGLVSGLVGSTVRVVVKATNGGGSTEVASPATTLIAALLPGNVQLPSVLGSLLDGQTLSAATGTWSGTTPISYGYQWLQCNASGESCKEISGATGATLGLISSLIGDTVKVVVKATNSGGSTEATSAASSVIAALLPSNTSLPAIVGSLIDGQTLSGSSGTWNGSGPISYAYQWQKCNAKGEACEDLSGKTAPTLGLVSGLVGSTVRVVVTATNSGGSVEQASAASSLIAALLPGNTSLPSVVGSLVDGQTLSVANGSWSGSTPLSYGYQWLQCNGKGESCKEISGATGGTLALISSLVGNTVKVVVTATNSGGSTSATSSATSAIAALLPGNTALPSVSGLLQDGQSLTASAGSWTGTGPISYGYQWLQCNGKGESCKEISGETGTTLGLISSLVGDTVKVVVTATNSGGSTEATSTASSVVAALLPSNTALPGVVGSLIDGQTLSVANGSWSGTTPISYGYQWLQCNGKGESCKEVSGATGGTLALVSGLVGNTVKVVVKATNSGGTTEATSAASSVIAALLPSNTALPSVVGSLIDGQTLSVANGSWSGTTPISYGYQWLQCNGKGESCKEISGATAGTLGLISSLVGDTVKVVVKATNSGGSTEATSAASSVIAALLPSNTSLPGVVGSLVDGQTLSVANGSWRGSTPLSYSYQWLQCNGKGESCKEISGATGGTLALISSLVGNTVKVVVKATNSGGSTEATSAASSVIAALLPGNTSLPGVAGSLIDGQTLTASNGSWTGTGPISYGYQWLQCNGKGESCKEISGATGTTLGLISSLVGDTVKVVVTATNSGGSTEATSAASSVIAALLPGNTSLPGVAGSLVDGQTLTASNGSWTGTAPISYGYQWLQCNGKGEGCKEISGATGGTLALVSGLVGNTVKVVVKATNSGGSTEATSAASSVIAALLPSSTALPSVVGSLVDGQTLTASNGSWSGTAPISYGYQWQKCNAKGESCENLSGKTAETLALVSSLVGSTVRVVVKATNSGGSTEAASTATTVIAALLPGNTSLPGVAGSLIDGQTLTASNGSWSGTAPISYSYQWQKCNAKGESCENLSGKTSETLALVSSLVGSTMRVVVKATNSGGSTEATSAATGLIAALLPKSTALPTIGGVAEDKQALTSTTGTWEGTTPITYSYQWEKCNSAGESCSNLAATGEGLSVIESLIKSTVRLVVTAKNSAGSTSATSAPTSVVLAALPANEVVPTVTGVLELGKTLLAHAQKWGGTQQGLAYTYQWQTCGVLGLVGECKNIGGAAATKENFVLELLDVGLTMRVGVTATNERGSSTAYSAATGLISGLKLSPVKGAAGTNVAVKGAGVNAATVVNFGEAQVFAEPKSSTEVTATAPEGTGTVPVTLSTPEGTTHETSTTQFTYTG